MIRKDKESGSRLWLVCVIGALLNITVARKGFVNFQNLADGAFDDDGFNIQILDAIRFIGGGFDYSSYGRDGILLFVHSIRLLAAAPFFAVNSILGVFGQSLLIYAFVFFAIKTTRERLQGSAIYLLALLPLLISWRSILVMMSILLLLNYIADNCSGWLTLFSSIILGSLSSASLLFAVATLFYFRKRVARSLNFPVLFCLAFLGAMTAIVVYVKFLGFSGGESGYESEYTSNPVLSMLYRSTFFIKLIYGSTLKQAAYLLMIIAVGATAFTTLVNPRKLHIDWLYIIALGGLLVEGMGAMVLAMVLILKVGRMKLITRHFSISKATFSKQT